MRSSRPVLFCKKGVLANFAKFTRKTQMFPCGFSKISHNTFFKEPFGRLLLHKHSFWLYCPTRNFHLLKKRYHTYFLAQYFFRFNLEAGNKSELSISNPDPEAYFQPSQTSGMELFL